MYFYLHSPDFAEGCFYIAAMLFLLYLMYMDAIWEKIGAAKKKKTGGSKHINP
jgi:hypothetical protein